MITEGLRGEVAAESLHIPTEDTIGILAPLEQMAHRNDVF